MEMMTIVKDMCARMSEVEETILAGYEGRRQEMKSVLS